MNWARLQHIRSTCKNQVLLYTGNEKYKSKIKQTILLGVVLVRLKHLGTNSVKQLWDFY